MKGGSKTAGGSAVPGSATSNHPNQIYARKKQLLDGAAAVFLSRAGKEASREAELSELYAKIGQLTVEPNFFITEVRAMKPAERVAMVDRG
jgi:hypothetical protein